MSQPDIVTTGDICKALGLQMTAGFIADVLLVQPAGKERNGVLWRRADFPMIQELLVEHIKNAKLP